MRCSGERFAFINSGRLISVLVNICIPMSHVSGGSLEDLMVSDELFIMSNQGLEKCSPYYVAHPPCLPCFFKRFKELKNSNFQRR